MNSDRAKKWLHRWSQAVLRWEADNHDRLLPLKNNSIQNIGTVALVSTAFVGYTTDSKWAVTVAIVLIGFLILLLIVWALEFWRHEVPAIRGYLPEEE